MADFVGIPQQFNYPKAFQLHASGLPMLRIVIPECCALPKTCPDLSGAFQTIPMLGTVWLFCFSSAYESKLSTLSQTKKASHIRERLCSEIGI
jgi:hypothetical protein